MVQRRAARWVIGDCSPYSSVTNMLGDFKKKIVDRADFSDQFKKNIVRYKRIGYNINIMRVCMLIV